jgi:hypothetical protein
MKKLFLCCVVTFFTSQTMAQSTLLRVLDQNNLQAVQGAKIWSGTISDAGSAQFSSILGDVSINFRSDSVFAQALGYGLQGFSVSALKKTGKQQILTLFLKPVVTGFDEVVISASRFF